MATTPKIPARASANGKVGNVIPPDIKSQEEQISGSGFMRFGGIMFNIADYNPTLQGQQGAKIYEEMRKSDPEVAAGLARITQPLRAAHWGIEPVDEKDEKEVEIAKFCEKWIMGRGRLDKFATKWAHVLDHLLLALSDGFSALEAVWGIDQEGNQVYKTLAGILPKTVWQFVFKTDGSGDLDYILQRAWSVRGQFVEARIPAEKLIVLTFNREADNLWGTPILRNVYKPWYWKDKLWRIDGMRHERHGLGFTKFKIPNGSNPDQKRAAEDIVREARANERGYVVFEEDFDVEISYPTGAGTDVIGSIKYMDQQIAQVLFSEFMHLGSTESGSRAVSQSKIDLLLANLQGMATAIEDAVEPLIVELVAKNFGQRDEYPRMKCEDLSSLSGPLIADILQKMMAATVGAITPGPDIEQFLREAYSLPLIPDDMLKLMQEIQKVELENKLELLKNPPQPPPLNGPPPFGGKAPVPANGPIPPSPGGPNDDKVPKGQPQMAIEPTLPRLARAPLAHEQHCMFADMSVYLQDEPKKIWHRTVAPFRKAQIVRIASAVSNSTDEEFKAGKFFPNGQMPLRGRLVKDLTDALMPVYLRGRQTVVDERNRQLTKTAASYDIHPEDSADDIQPTSDERKWVGVIAGAFTTLMLGSLMTEASRTAQNARNADASRKDQERQIISDLESMSVPVQQANLAGAVNQSFINGRSEQAKSMSDTLQTAFYTAIMDEGTCEPCAALDGQEHEPFDPNFATPNPDCAWPSNCRCTDVWVFRDEPSFSDRLAYDPEEPREPAGGPGGGQWTSGGSSGGSGGPSGGASSSGSSSGLNKNEGGSLVDKMTAVVEAKIKGKEWDVSQQQVLNKGLQEVKSMEEISNEGDSGRLRDLHATLYWNLKLLMWPLPRMVKPRAWQWEMDKEFLT